MLLNVLSSYISSTDEGYVYEDVWTSYAKDALSGVLLWLVVALLVVLLAVGVFVRLKRPDFLRTYVKFAIAFTAGIAVVIVTAMLSLEFFDMSENGYIFDLVLWPTVALAIVIVLSIAACYISSFYSAKSFKVTLIVCLSFSVAALIALFVCLGIYFTSGDAANNNWVSQESINGLGLYLCAAGLVVVILALTFFLGRKDRKKFDSRTISYAAVCIAMSFALSYIQLFTMPQGGSVTLASLLPLMIYSYMFGVKKGVFAGFIYGILQALQDPWLIHPAQFLLDYPVAFATIGLSGMFRNVKAFQGKPQLAVALGGIVASVLRFASHLFSGVFAFSEYAGDQNPWIYSMAYNSFVFIDIAIVLVVGVIVFSSKSFMTFVNKYNGKKDAPAQEPAPEAEQK